MTTKPAIAVITVHGVGKHEPGAMPAAVVDQLQHFVPGQFGTFACTPLRIPVDATALPPRAPGIAPTATASWEPPDGVGVRARHASPARHGPQATDIDFTALTLAGGHQYTDSYSTTCLHGQDSGGKPVDLYEMYWSDLSHGGAGGGWTALRQTLQLFLHVASLGRTALGTLLASRGQRDHLPSLTAVYTASAWGYWLVAVPIAMGNLLLVCLGTAFLALLLPSSGAGPIGTGIALAVAAACAGGVAVRSALRAALPPAPLLRLGLPALWLLAVAAAVLGAWWLHTTPAWTPGAALALALAAALLFGTAVARRYGVTRPGALPCWYATVATCALWGCAIPWVVRPNGETVDLHTWFVVLAEGCFAWLAAAWLIVVVVNLWLLGASLYAGWRHRYRDIGRSITTGLVAASVPAPLLLFVMLLLWSAAAQWLNARGADVMNLPVGSLFGPGKACVSERLRRLIDLSASPAAGPFLLLAALALTCVVLAFLPSVLAELVPPKEPKDPARSRGLWRWLDAGFNLLGIPKWIMVGAFFAVLPAGAALQYGGLLPQAVQDVIDPLRPNLGLVLGGGALAYLSITRLFAAISVGRLARGFARLRVVIDTAIDVDNWLRERPVGATPRLRIMARYASLLRHLAAQGYERVVIVAHSQGTVITADLLRYLKAHGSPLLAQLGAIDLLTFGCPLRQLYAARFPAIYGWAEDIRIQDLGVACWTNGYGSGDYVGRDLWHPGARSAWQPGRVPGRRDFCVGALAHTRYFGNEAPDVAAAIAAAITDGCPRAD